MIIKTRKLPATSHDGERMRATADTGASLTLPFDYSWNDPHEVVANSLVCALFPAGSLATRVTGNVFEVTES
jgi:hypothetical protein